MHRDTGLLPRFNGYCVYKVWTCGAMASRLHETSIQKENGEWILPLASDVYEDYMNSTGDEIRLPKAAIKHLKDHEMKRDLSLVPHFAPHMSQSTSHTPPRASAAAGS